MTLSEPQLQIVINILISAGEVFLASLVVPFFLGTFSVIAFIFGMVFTAAAWFVALIVGKRIL